MAHTKDATPLETAKAFLAGIKARDTTGMREMCHPAATACNIRNGVPVHWTINDILGMMDRVPDDVTLNETSRDEIEHIDGAFATVWTPYEFWEGGKLHHTGSNNFCMWKSPEKGWTITAVQDIAHAVEGVEAEPAPFAGSR